MVCSFVGVVARAMYIVRLRLICSPSAHLDYIGVLDVVKGDETIRLERTGLFYFSSKWQVCGEALSILVSPQQSARKSFDNFIILYYIGSL